MTRSQALDRAEHLMNMKGGMMRLDTVWGVGGPRRPVRSLVKQMTMLLKEFLTSSDTEEAIRCVCGRDGRTEVGLGGLWWVWKVCLIWKEVREVCGGSGRSLRSGVGLVGLG